MRILLIGDSHAGYWEGWQDMNLEGVTVDTSQAKPSRLMYSWSRDKVDHRVAIKNGDVVIFCLGEIDVRAHVHKYRDNWRDNIKNLVDNYLINVEKNVKGFSVTTVIYNVIPHLNIGELPGVPKVGTPEDIKKYTLYMNSLLKKESEKYGYNFIDTYWQYCNEDGFLLEEMSDMICHIKNPIHNKNWIIENFMQ